VIAINLEATAARAATMTDAELDDARMDAARAARCADRLALAGLRVAKSGGYYLDRASVYAAEQARRAQEVSL